MQFLPECKFRWHFNIARYDTYRWRSPQANNTVIQYIWFVLIYCGYLKKLPLQIPWQSNEPSGPTLLFCLFNRLFRIWNILYYRLMQSVQQRYKVGRRNIKWNAFFRRSDKYSSAEEEPADRKDTAEVYKMIFFCTTCIRQHLSLFLTVLKRNEQYIEYFFHEAMQLGNSLTSNIFYKINMNGFIKNYKMSPIEEVSVKSS